MAIQEEHKHEEVEEIRDSSAKPTISLGTDEDRLLSAEGNGDLENQFLPEVDQVKECLKTFNTTIFLQQILHQFHELIFYMSMLEAATLVLLVLFFMRSPASMWFAMFHVFHIFRCILGFKIDRKLPKSHNLITGFSPPTEEAAKEKMSFNEIEQRLKETSLQVIKDGITRQEGRLRCYCWLTIICIVGDLFDFFIQWVRFGRKGDEYSDMLLIFACVLLVLSDSAYFGWLYHTNLLMPTNMGVGSFNAMLGYGDKVKGHLGKELVIAKKAILESKDKAGKGFKSLAGMRKAKRSESGNPDDSVKTPTLAREVEV